MKPKKKFSENPRVDLALTILLYGGGAIALTFFLSWLLNSFL